MFVNLLISQLRDGVLEASAAFRIEAIPSLALPAHRFVAMFSLADIERWSGLLSGVLVVLLAYQQWRLYKLRRRSAQREELFRIVTENAADMIAWSM